MRAHRTMSTPGLPAAYTPPPMPFHLLELTLISAQDLPPATFRLRAYAVAWANAEYKLRTPTDSSGNANPVWNDRFVFRLDSAFLQSFTSSISIEIYATRLHPFRDRLLGTARLILSTLHLPTPGATLAAIQIRRPSSLRPQGILNVGVALLDAKVRSMPLIAADLGVSEAMPLGNRTIQRQQAHQAEDMEVERKLAKWKSEMSPAQQEIQKSDGGKRGRWRGWLSCCGCGRRNKDERTTVRESF